MDPISTGHLLPKAEQEVLVATEQAFNAFFREAKLGVLGSLTADAFASDLPPALGGWPGSQLWTRLVNLFIAPAIDAVFGTSFAEAARTDLLGIDSYRQSFVAEATDRLSASLWPEEAFGTVQREMQTGIAERESPGALRDRIASSLSLNRFSYLAERIARTEAHAAVEGGSHAASAAYEEVSGVAMYQRWIATNDTRTRQSHRDASGQTVRLNEAFRVGGASLLHPGDPLGPAEEVIQCRCSTLIGPLEDLDLLPPSPADNLGASADMTAPTDLFPEVTETFLPSEGEVPETIRWRGILAPLEIRGDYRVLGAPEGGQVSTNAQMWLSYQERSGEGHDGKVTVGRIDRAWIQDGNVWGEGDFDVNDETGNTQRVIRLLDEGFAGTVSVDLSDGDFTYGFYNADDEPIEPPEDPDELMEALEAGTVKELVYVKGWRLGGATLVQDPAFHTARISLIHPASGAVTAAAVGDMRLPLAEREQEWDGDAAKARLAEAGRLNQGTFWREEEADPDSDIQSDYRLPFADIIDGELRAVPQAIFSVASVLQGGMGGVDLPVDAKDAIADRVEDYYDRMRDAWGDDSVRAPWDEDDDDDDFAGKTAALAASGYGWADKVAERVPANPPERWFVNPKLTGLTKLQVTEDGRVYGHIADWKQRHIGFLGEKVFPPRDPNKGAYSRFHRNPVRTAEGGRINTGPLTSGGHASTEPNVSMAGAMAHYDDPRYVIANVVCGEDEFGIWVAGALRAGVEAWQVSIADTYAFSGDWRFGELVAACTVSVPGFHVPNDPSVLALAASAGVQLAPGRVREAMHDGRQSALLSAGLVKPFKSGKGGSHGGLDRIASLMSENHAQVREVLAALPAEVADMAYEAARRAVREEKEIADLARKMSEAELAEIAKEMGGVA